MQIHVCVCVHLDQLYKAQNGGGGGGGGGRGQGKGDKTEWNSPVCALVVAGSLQQVLRPVLQEDAKEVPPSLLNFLVDLRSVVQLHNGPLNLDEANLVLHLEGSGGQED